MDFKSLKKASNSVDRLNKALEDQNKKNFNNDDEGFWKPERDKAGNFFGEIRFLPAPPQDGEDGLPWVKYWRHSFRGPGGWYIQRSLTSIGKSDPVSELNTKLWNTGLEENKNRVRKQKRQLTYVSNILVISDPTHPENEGKVFKYRYGSKIFEKITEKRNPSFPGEVGFDVFDFWAGANFKVKVRTIKDGENAYPNYDKSEFAAPSQLFGGDDKKLEALWHQEYSLKEINDPKNYEDYETLKKDLNRVLGVDEEVHEEPKTSVAPVTATKPISKKVDDVPPWEDLPKEDDSDGETMSYFRKLAEED